MKQAAAGPEELQLQGAAPSVDVIDTHVSQSSVLSTRHHNVCTTSLPRSERRIMQHRAG